MANLTVTLTTEQLEALGYALDLAHGDQEHYLRFGSPEADYGAEWEFTKTMRAAQFRQIAEVGKNLGLHGEHERWNALAKEMEDCH